jgi:hypothetical protein
MWWHTPVIPALSRLRQEDQQVKVSLGYMQDLISKQNKKKEERRLRKRRRRRRKEEEEEVVVVVNGLNIPTKGKRLLDYLCFFFLSQGLTMSPRLILLLNFPSKTQQLWWLTPIIQENLSSKPARANSSRDPILKTPNTKKDW